MMCCYRIITCFSLLFLSSIAFTTEIILFSQDKPAENYDDLIQRMTASDILTFSEGRSFQIISLVGEGNTTKIFAVQNSQEEYIFSAPNEIQTSYKVEVFGKSDFILKQVREVEPKAFIKGNIIQVGIFSEEENAIDLVKKLTLQGLWARVVVQ